MKRTAEDAEERGERRDVSVVSASLGELGGCIGFFCACGC